MRHDTTPYWIFMIPLAMVAIGYFIAFTRKGRVATASLGSRRLEVRSPADPATVFQRLLGLESPYVVDDKDASANILVLSSPVTFFTWGFLYPVYLHAEGGGTRIEIGCQSKFVQMGPLVGKAHRNCVTAIEQALSVPTARIA